MRIRQARRGLGAVLVACLVGVLAPAVTAGPAQAFGTYHKMTGVELRHWAVGRSLGPNVHTDWGKLTITGFTYLRTTAHGARIWRTNKDTCGARCLSPVGPAGVAYPNSWYNPASWDWGGIFGKIWDKITACDHGALVGFVGTASGAVLVNLLAHSPVIYVGPYNYAAVMIGGCLIAAMGW